MNREKWLTEVASQIEGHYFNANDVSLDAYKVTCSWPSSRGLTSRRRTLGQCFHAKASSAGIYEIFISPTLSDNVEVAAVLAHEMCHVADKCQNGHGAPFTKLARMCELEGKPTATVAGEAFKRWVETKTPTLGDYPHAEIEVNARSKKQSTRMIKCRCVECDYIVRTSRKNLERAVPRCPDEECISFMLPMAV